jgi:hypothetical protein
VCLSARLLDVATKSDKAAARSARAYTNRKWGRGKRSFNKAAKLSRNSAKLARPFDFKHC